MRVQLRLDGPHANIIGDAYDVAKAIERGVEVEFYVGEKKVDATPCHNGFAFYEGCNMFFIHGLHTVGSSRS